MTSRETGVSLQMTDDDTTYENIAQKTAVSKFVNVYHKVKSSSPRETSTKTVKSEAHPKVSSVTKNNKNLTKIPYAKQKSKTMKFIATTLFLGVLVLAIALVLVLYYMVIRNNNDKSNSNTPIARPTTAVPLPQVLTAPDVPGYPDPTRMPCYIVANWLPLFDFLTYGEHAAKTMGYFATLKNEYFKLRKQVQDPTLDIIVEKGTNLIEKMLNSVVKMHELHYHDDLMTNRFEKYVGSWLKCTTNKTVNNCAVPELKLTQIMKAYHDGTKKISNISYTISETFGTFSNLLKGEKLFWDTAHADLLPNYLTGFVAFCRSLEIIFSTIFYKRNDLNGSMEKFPRFASCEEYACLVIAERALDAWSKPDSMLRSACTNQDSELTYWKDNNVAQQFMNIADGFSNDLKGQTAKILENWTCDI